MLAISPTYPCPHVSALASCGSIINKPHGKTPQFEVCTIPIFELIGDQLVKCMSSEDACTKAVIDNLSGLVVQGEWGGYAVTHNSHAVPLKVSACRARHLLLSAQFQKLVLSTFVDVQYLANFVSGAGAISLSGGICLNLGGAEE